MSFAPQNAPVLQPARDHGPDWARSWWCTAFGTIDESQVYACGPPRMFVHSVSRGGFVISGGNKAPGVEGWPGNTITTGNLAVWNWGCRYSGGSHTRIFRAWSPAVRPGT